MAKGRMWVVSFCPQDKWGETEIWGVYDSEKKAQDAMHGFAEELAETAYGEEDSLERVDYVMELVTTEFKLDGPFSVNRGR